jgi:DNA-binding FadR family transcriptional regulator
MMRKYLSTIEGRHERALQEHKEILQAVIEKDKEKAKKLSKYHSESSKRALLKKLDKQN